jgi:cell division protein FtsB
MGGSTFTQAANRSSINARAKAATSVSAPSVVRRRTVRDSAVELTKNLLVLVDFGLYSTTSPCTLWGKALFSHGHIVKKARTSKAESGTALRRRGRRAVQYVLVLIGCIIVVDALVGDKGLLAMRKARQQYQALENALAAERSENDRMREEARRLHEDPTAIEDLARRELGLIKPGEKLFILRDVPPPAQKN